MTDLERARIVGGIIDAYTLAPNDEDERRDAVARCVDAALAAGRREGAAEMRERALEAARDGVRVAFGERRDQEFIDQNDVIGSIEDAFASTLPLTPEEPT